MKRNLFALLSLLVMASMMLAACGGAAVTEAPTEEPAAPTEAPAATVTPAATEAPTEAPAAFEGMSVAADSCDYGGEFKSIEAVDATTVKFTLCYPGPSLQANSSVSCAQ